MKKTIVLGLLVTILTVPAIAGAERNQRSDNSREKNQQETQQNERKQSGKQHRETPHSEARNQQTQRRENSQPEARDHQGQRRESQSHDNLHQNNYSHDNRDTHQNSPGNREQYGQRNPDRQHEGWRQNNHTEDRNRQGERHSWSHPVYHNNYWMVSQYSRHGDMPFRWHQNSVWFADRYRMERLYGRDWDDRFPGLRVYRWYDRDDGGFWYHGHRIRHALMFYNEDDEFVSVGFVFNGVFIFLRDDNLGYENHDSFFISWWDRHMGISIRL